MINHHLTLKSRRLAALSSLLLLAVMGGCLTACMSDNTAPQVAAQGSQRPAPTRSDDIISRRIYDRINDVIALRDSGNLDDAMAIMNEIKALDEAGRLNKREQFVMWQFIANLELRREHYGEAIAAYNRILARPDLTDDQREQTSALLAAARRSDRAAATGTDTLNAEVVTDDTAFTLNPAKTEMLPVSTVQPTYPQEAVDQGIEGWALVAFTVTETGAVRNARIVDAEPEKVFDEASLAAVSEFTFNPRMQDGRAVAANGVRYLFRFSLQ